MREKYRGIFSQREVVNFFEGSAWPLGECGPNTASHTYVLVDRFPGTTEEQSPRN
jgi:hypothetical protein